MLGKDRSHRRIHRTPGHAGHCIHLRLETLEIRANPSTFTVDDNLAQFKRADFTSIQAAVDAASPGDRIRVFPGTYHEQVVIPSTLHDLDLRAVGKSAETIIAPTSFGDPSEAVIRVAGAQNVSIRGFLITGQHAPQGTTLGADFGVLVDEGGSASVIQNHITTIRDLPLTGEQEGVGIQFGFTDSMGTVLSTGSGDARDNTIEDYQKGGVVVIGDGSQANVEHNVIVGVGATSVIAQNGIQISDGAFATVRLNTVSGNNYSIPTVVAVGILVIGSDAVVVGQNDVFANNDGIHVEFSDGSSISHNKVTQNTNDGIILFETTNSVVTHNVSSDNGHDGIDLDTSSGNLIAFNFAFNNGRYGIAIEATSTGNTVRNNQLGGNAVGELFVGNPMNNVSKNHIRSMM